MEIPIILVEDHEYDEIIASQLLQMIIYVAFKRPQSEQEFMAYQDLWHEREGEV